MDLSPWDDIGATISAVPEEIITFDELTKLNWGKGL